MTTDTESYFDKLARAQLTPEEQAERERFLKDSTERETFLRAQLYPSMVQADPGDTEGE